MDKKEAYISSLPQFHFDTVYKGSFEITEEGRKELDKILRETNAESERFFSVFENDLLSCILRRCDACSLNGKENCKYTLIMNIDRMLDNQKRMYIAFNKQRYNNEKS